MLFWNYVVAALQAIEPAVPLTPPAGLLGEQDFVDAIVPRLLNELASLESGVVLVLDDYHGDHQPGVPPVGRVVPDREPANVHIIVASRVDPPSRSARCGRAANCSSCARPICVHSAGEHALPERRARTGAVDRAAATLHEHAEGWPAGLYLAYLSLGTRPIASAPSPASADPPPGQRLPHRGCARCPGARGARLPGRDVDPRADVRPALRRHHRPRRLAELLIGLEHANLFLTALDDHREWYRYHHLFAELLLAELQRRAPERRRELHRNAFAWLAGAGHVGEAIHHALVEAGEIETAARLVAENYLSTIEWGGYATVAGWLDAFPRRVVVGDARLSVVEAWVASFQRRRDDAQLALGTPSMPATRARCPTAPARSRRRRRCCGPGSRGATSARC